jgi:hypothetical protein
MNDTRKVEMFVGTKAKLNKQERVSRGFIAVSFINHFKLDTYSSAMIEDDEIFDASQDAFPKTACIRPSELHISDN